MPAAPDGRLLPSRARTRWLALGAIVLASALAGQPMLPAAANVALSSGLLLLAAWSSQLGLAALLASALLSPWSVSTGTYTHVALVLPLLAALLAGWSVRWLRRRDRAILHTSAVQAAVAFAAVAALSFGVAAFLASGCGFQAPLRAQLGALAGMVLPVGALVVAADELDRRSVDDLTWLFLLLGGGAVAYRFLPGLWRLSASPFQPGAGGSLFWVWLVALAGGQALANRRLHAEWRVALAWMVVVVFYQTYAGGSDWLAGWVPPLLALFVVTAFATPRIALAVGIAGALGLAVLWGSVAPRVADTDNLYSLSTRLDAWAIMWRLIAIDPVLGLGPANYYHCTPLYPIRGFTVHFSSHNNYVDIVAQTGGLGLLCLLWFAAACGAAGWTVWRRAPADSARGVVCGCLGGLAGTLVAAMLGDWWIPFIYNVTLDGLRSSILAWIFLGAAIALARETAAPEGAC